MDPIHRKRIEDLIEVDSYSINILALGTYSIQNEIFNQDDCNILTWSRNLNNPDTPLKIT